MIMRLMDARGPGADRLLFRRLDKRARGLGKPAALNINANTGRQRARAQRVARGVNIREREDARRLVLLSYVIANASSLTVYDGEREAGSAASGRLPVWPRAARLTNRSGSPPRAVEGRTSEIHCGRFAQCAGGGGGGRQVPGAAPHRVVRLGRSQVSSSPGQ
jgi:hypothetical protein